MKEVMMVGQAVLVVKARNTYRILLWEFFCKVAAWDRKKGRGV
jgi:hypothetical protein